ncbi:protein-disulfide reductase DsbD family protein [Haliea sp. E17]|uniref:protein-disulfide reductase DsbD family protein n=1 Tax=Haliea sp. E17 TaxID=3401576 RepID=UPI003AAA44DC
MRTLLVLCLLLFIPASLGQGFPGSSGTGFGAGETQQFLPVEEAYRLNVEIEGSQQLRLYWQITEAYYLYQHSFKFRLVPAAGGVAVELEAEFPPALQRTDEFFGEVQVYYNDADINLALATPLVPGDRIEATYQGCADAGLCYPPRTEAFLLDPASGTASPVAPLRKSVTPPATATTAASKTAGALPYMLLLAFLGGAILNLMPCVFPILSLKVLSFANSSEHNRHLHSWVYTLGVVTSFVAIAAVLIALQQAGRAVGWGFQLQAPGFVIALAYLFLAMGLSLSGVVHLGGSLMNAGSGLASRGGLGGSFFTGVLAVVVASPCTAPFMGTALGFAVTQPPAISLLVFASLGCGMAAPLLLFGYSRTARRIMPAPGPWMETLKQFLAFPLYAAAVWLLWVAGRQTGVNTMAAVLGGAVTLALALWLWQLGQWRRWLAVAFAGATIALGSLHNLDPRGDSTASSADYLRWTEDSLAELRAEGVPVFVDVTADWCITCLANEAAVLSRNDVQEAFRQRGVAYMVADWTNHDPAIAHFIARYGRTGIPLYLLYPADAQAEPLILPQILTPGTVLQAIDSLPESGLGANLP